MQGAEIGVLPKAPPPCPLLLLPVYYLLDGDHFLPEFFFFFYSVEVSALPLGAFRFRRPFDLEPWASSSLSQWAQFCPHPHTLESFDF